MHLPIYQKKANTDGVVTEAAPELCLNIQNVAVEALLDKKNKLEISGSRAEAAAGKLQGSAVF